ncbi:hypothetical protein BYT27DRAFT_7255491 [Phlegmacium glaucopus]|nr:hypothetical protein BYT27DRAFT_7255491 [Phlegmacium glaucopus]
MKLVSLLRSPAYSLWLEEEKTTKRMLQGWSSEDHRRPTTNGGTSDHPPPSPPPERQLAEQNTGYRSTEPKLNFRDQITNITINQVAANVFNEPDKLADFTAAVSTSTVQELQDVLESLVVDDRLPKALLVLKKETHKCSTPKFLGVVIRPELFYHSRSNCTQRRLTDVKSRILEFLVVCKLRGAVRGKIISLDQQIQLGGLTDVAEIKGHIRTYIGALPGSAQIIQALKRVEIETPLVLVDEVDKIGRGINGETLLGDLSMSLTGSLQHDPWTSHGCSSCVLVCCHSLTSIPPADVGELANNFDTIPPLLDPMEVLEVSGYVFEEKGHRIESSAVDVLVKYYCRESGVRNTSRRCVIELGEDTFPEPKQLPPNEPIFNPTTTITEADQKKPVTTKERKPMHTKGRMYTHAPPRGVNTGLGYLGNGSGAVMPIEAMVCHFYIAMMTVFLLLSDGYICRLQPLQADGYDPSPMVSPDVSPRTSMESSSRSADVQARDTIISSPFSSTSFSTYPTFCACLEFFIPTSFALSISFSPFFILRRLTRYRIKLSTHHSQTFSNVNPPSVNSSNEILTSLLCINRSCHFGCISLNAITPDGSVVGILAKQLKMAECPRELPPFMIELSIIGREATLILSSSSTADGCISMTSSAYLPFSPVASPSIFVLDFPSPPLTAAAARASRNYDGCELGHGGATAPILIIITGNQNQNDFHCSHPFGCILGFSLFAAATGYPTNYCDDGDDQYGVGRIVGTAPTTAPDTEIQISTDDNQDDYHGSRPPDCDSSSSSSLTLTSTCACGRARSSTSTYASGG